MQTKVFPDALASRKQLPFEQHVLLELDEDILNVDEGIFRLRGPIPISRIQRIFFSDQHALKEFKAIYGMMPDIPLSHFQLEVLPEDNFELAGDPVEAKLPKFRNRKLRDDPSQLAATLIGVREAILTVGDALENFSTLRVRNPTSRLVCKAVIQELLTKVDFLSETPESALELLDLYFDVANSLETSRKVEATKIVASMQSGIEDRFDSGGVTDELRRVVVSVLAKTHQAILGMESNLEFKDKTSLILQRAVCLACMAADLEAFDAMRRNLSIGPVVEAIARLLVASRSRLNRIEARRWRASREEMDSILNSATNCFSANVIELHVERSKLDENFSFHEHILFSGNSISDKTVPASHQALLVISMLKSCGYSPKPDSNGDIQIEFLPSSGTSTISVGLRLRVGPTQAHRQNVQISTLCPGGEAWVSKAVSRRKVFEIAENYMVSLSRGPRKGEMLLSRYQLLDTMDKDELNYNVELVAGVAESLSTELLL